MIFVPRNPLCPRGGEECALGWCSRSKAGTGRDAAVKIRAAMANSCVVAVGISVEIPALTVRENLAGRAFACY